jgi:hypothetical protein
MCDSYQRVGLQLLFCQPTVGTGGCFYGYQVAVQSLHSGVQCAVGSSHGLLPDKLSRLVEKQANGYNEDGRSQKQYGNGKSGG